MFGAEGCRGGPYAIARRPKVQDEKTALSAVPAIRPIIVDSLYPVVINNAADDSFFALAAHLRVATRIAMRPRL